MSAESLCLSEWRECRVLNGECRATVFAVSIVCLVIGKYSGELTADNVERHHSRKLILSDHFLIFYFITLSTLLLSFMSSPSCMD